MLKIFDKNHNAIGHIVKYKDCKIESELSTGDKTLYFTYMAKHHNLENEMYVRTKEDEYVIKEVPGTTGSFPQIVAVLNLEDLQKDMWQTFSVTDVTIDEAVRTVLAGTGWTIGECNVTKRRNAGMIQVSSLEVIQNLCTAFMCEPAFDTINKKVSFYVQRGEDKGVYFMSGLNLKKIQKKSTSYDYFTRIIPIGANGLTIESVNDGKNYLENYQYSNKELTYIWKDESYTDAQALKDDAELKLNDLSKPTLSYSADVRDLAKQKTEYAILSYSLGDNVTLIDLETGTRDKQRIIKLVEYPQNLDKNTCELANTVLTFEEMQKKVQDAANIINFTIAGDGRYTGTINVSDILHFEQGVAGSNTISAINSSISTMQGDLAQVKMTVGELDANCIRADEADLKYATIENLNVTNETVHSIQGDYASFKSTVTDEFAATTADITNISGELSTYKTQVAGQLTAFDAYIASLRAKDAELETAVIGKASIEDLDAVRTRTQQLETDVADINTLVNGNLTSDNIQNLTLNSKNTTIENGMIKNAMIESLAFDKITGIDVNTTKLTVHSDDGKSTWTDNTIQISDANRVRVQMGKDASGDYTLAVWDSTGKLIWDALGATENTIQRKIIRDAVVADDAAIAGSKLDIESVVKEVNGATTKLKSTTILLDDKNQTLDVAFNAMESTVSSNLSEAKSYADSKASSTLSSAQQYALNQANTALSSAKSYTDAGIEGIEIGGRNYLINPYNAVAHPNQVSWSYDAKTGTYNLQVTNQGGGFQQVYFTSIVSDISAIAGKEVTITIEGYECTDTNLDTRLYFCPTTTANGTGVISNNKLLLNNDELKCTFTFPENALGAYLLLRFDQEQTASVGVSMAFRGISLQLGAKPTDWSPAPEDTEAEITNLTEITTTHTTSISTMQGQISSLIAEDTTIKGNYDALVSRYNSTVATVDSMQTTIGEHTTLLDSQSEQILAVQTKANTIESDLSGTKQTVSSIQNDLTSTKSRVTTVETGLDGLKTRVSDAESALTKKADGTTVDSLTSRVATCETTLDGFEASLTATNKTVIDNYTELKNYTDSAKSSAISTAASDATTKANSALESAKTYADSAVDGIEIGGRNLLLNSKGEFSKQNGSINLNISDYGKEILGGATVTISFDAKSDIETMIDTYPRYGDSIAYTGIKKGFAITTSYTRCSATLTLDASHEWTAWSIRSNGNVSGGSTTAIVTIKNVKLEIGNKATDWSLAPEDIQSQIDTTNATVATHTEQISTHDTRITANENSIKLKVSTSEYESYKTTVNNEIASAKSRLSTAESSITALNGQIALKVEQTDIDTAISNIEVGGTQLLKNTNVEGIYSTAHGWSYFGDNNTATRNNISVTDAPNKAILYGVSITPTNTSYTYAGMFQNISMPAGTSYTMSCYARGTGTLCLRFAYRLSSGGNSTYKVKTHTLTGNWARYSYTLLADIDLSGVAFGVNTSGSVEMCGFKLEVGTKATDWSPAIEDIDSSISAVDAKFTNYSTTTQMTAAITAAKDSITASVSETYATKASLETANSNITSLTSRVQTAESKLTKDGLTTIVGDYYTTATVVDSKIDGIEVGGRNLLLNSVTKKINAYSGSAISFETVEVSEWRASDAIRVYGTGGTSTVFGTMSGISGLSSIGVNGTNYVYSIFVKNNHSSNTIYIGANGYSSTKKSVGPGETTRLIIKITADGTRYLQFNFYTSSSGDEFDFTYWHPKIEEGTQASDWTPAPEDVDTAISAVETIATQTSEKFNWLVKSGTSSTDFTLTDRTATLVANYINLNGLVTFSGLDSTAQGKITTAQSTADTAKTNAATAQNAADAATNARNGYAIKWNHSAFGTANDGEAYICAKNKTTNVLSDANGTVMFNGTTRTVSKCMINPNTYVPYNKTIYIVLRLSSSTATTGTNYLVWYNSGWKSGNVNASTSTTISDWTWNNETDIVLGSFVEPGSEMAFVDCQTYEPALTAQMVTSGNTSYANAATAQSTANTANSTANTVKTTVDAGKSNWDSAYAWTSGNGSNMTSLLSMVKQWTNNAVSDTTTIQGGWIATNTITANQIASGAIVTSKLAANAVTAEKMSVTSLSSISANLGSITAGSINIGSGKFTVSSDGTMTATGATLTGTFISNSAQETLQISDGIIYGKRGSTIDSEIDTSAYYQAGYFLTLTNHNGKIYMNSDTIEFFAVTEGATHNANFSANVNVGRALTVSGETYCKGAQVKTDCSNAMIVPSTGRICMYSSSSKRYKDIGREFTASDVSALYDVPVYWFKYKEGYLDKNDQRYGKEMPGFIVEEIEPVLPIAINRTKDGLPEMWSNNIMVPVMFEMIKDTHYRTVANTSDIIHLKEACVENANSVSNLSAQVSSLEYQLQQAFMRIATLEKQLQAAG